MEIGMRLCEAESRLGVTHVEMKQRKLPDLFQRLFIVLSYIILIFI